MNKSVKISSAINVEIIDPINIVYVITSSEGLVNTNTKFNLATNYTLTINEFFLSGDKTINGLINHQCCISIENKARLVLNRYQYPNNNFQICKDVIYQEEESYFTSNNFSSCGILVEMMFLKVNGENCHTNLMEYSLHLKMIILIIILLLITMSLIVNLMKIIKEL